MAHFAILNDQNIVEDVVVVPNEEIIENGQESEANGIEYLSKIFPTKKFKQTSYNKSLRKNYAGIGYYYDEARDAFIPPKPFPSWLLDEDKCIYVAPIEYPKDGKKYLWFESFRKWVVADR